MTRAAGRRALRQPAPSTPDTEPGARFRTPATAVVDPATPDHQRLAIRLICARPELRPLCSMVRFAVAPALDVPFSVESGERIVLHPGSLADPAGAALILRHALELALWRRLSRPELVREQRRVRAVLVCRVAARYGRLQRADEQARALAALPGWLESAYQIAADDEPDLERLPAELERLEGGSAAVRADASDLELVHELQTLAAPSEDLLISGGGSRLRLDPATGLNAYGCGALPRPDSLAFASSTASTISAPAYRAVETLRQELIEAGLAGRLTGALEQAFSATRQDILAACRVADLAGTEVVLTPSGTDGEYAALHLARRPGSEPLVNLVIAPDETGSGVLHATGGRHFANETPHAEAVTPGAPLAGLEPATITVETVEIRAPDGASRRLHAVDAEVKAAALRAVARGARCLVHLLEVSKSDLGAPSLRAVQELSASHADRIEVVVDACQMRGGATSLRGYLEAGWMVLLTGSKFSMGPPFAGALLVPARLAGQAAGLEPLPAGYGQYFARPEWPDAWQPLTAALPTRPNLGLLCRWHAGLTEMQAYQAVPEDLRARIVAELGAAIGEALLAAAMLEPAPGPSTGRAGPPTIFPFRILHRAADGQSRPMAVDAARRVWRWLREDLSERLPAGAAKAEQRLAARACHVGQPIRLGSSAGQPIGALRICIGAHLISAVAFDPSLGKTVPQRLKQQIGRARMVLEKAGLIARHYDHLCALGDQPAAP